MASGIGRRLRYFAVARLRWRPIGSAGVVALALSTLLAATGLNAQGFDVTPWPARKPAPDLQAPDLQGRVWRLADLRGKAVLVNFWASWCAPCQAEMPSLLALSRAQGSDRLVVLTVNFKESAPVALRFVQRNGLGDMPVLRDPDGAIARQWQVKVFPTTVLVGVDGKVRTVVRGELDWSGRQAAALLAPLHAASGTAAP